MFLEFVECSLGAEGLGEHGGGWGLVPGLSVKRMGWKEGSTVKARPSLCWLQRQRAVFSGC